MAASVDVRLVSPRRRQIAECWQKVFSDATTTMVEEDCGLFVSTCCMVQTMKSLSSGCLVCVAYETGEQVAWAKVQRMVTRRPRLLTMMMLAEAAKLERVCLHEFKNHPLRCRNRTCLIFQTHQQA